VARAALCALSLSAVVHAAPEGPQTPERVRARTLYGQGEKLVKSGDYQAAARAFEEAYQTLPNAIVLLKLADCRERLADYPGAVESLEKYLSEKPNAPDRASIEDHVAELRRKPGIVTVKSTPAGAAIWVDDKDSALVTPSDVELDPGEHKVTLKLLPYQSVDQSVVVEFGSKKMMDLTLPPPEAPKHLNAEATPAHTTDVEPQKTGSRKLGAPFWVAIGVTAAGAAVTTVFGVVALSKHSDFEKTPRNSIADDGERAAVISDIALGVAAAGAVTATVLFFTAPRDKVVETAFTFAPFAGPRAGGIVGNARF
jgi:hypothetical protein